MRRKIPKFISVFICLCLILEQAVFAEIAPSSGVAVLSNPPLLRYLSVNSANPFNYFNFLLDKGNQASLTGKTELASETKKLIDYFFLGITLPSESFWVNLRPDEPGRITSAELAKTDLGRTLLEQDLQLKKDVAKFTHPAHPKGKEFWEKLYTAIGKDKVNKTEIITSNRVWIVPDQAVVLETEDGALVVSAKLKVLLESDYLKGLSPKGIVPDFQNTQALSEKLMKEIILPPLAEEVNNGSSYAPLRQIYQSLILAEWFKIKHKNANNAYAFSIGKGYTKGLESQFPWAKQKIWQEYVDSYEKGEYKQEASIFGLRRMYWSGGITLMLDRGGGIATGEGGTLTSGSPIKIIQNKEAVYSDLFNEEAANMLIELMTNPSIKEGEMAQPEKIQAIPIGLIDEGTLSPEGLSAAGSSKEGVPSDDKLTGASPASPLDKTASSALAERKISRAKFLQTVALLTGAAFIDNIFPRSVQAVMRFAYAGTRDIAMLLQRANSGDRNAIIGLVMMVDNDGSVEARNALKQVDPAQLVNKIKEQDHALNSTVALGILVRNGNTKAIDALVDLVQQQNSFAITELKVMLINSLVLFLRKAHLEERVSDEKLEELLSEKTGNNPFLLYACFTSRENFGDLAKMILKRLDEARKNTDFYSFLKALDPQKLFFEEFILEAANFSLLGNVISSPDALSEVMQQLFNNLSVAKIRNYSVRLALFVEAVLLDKNFGYQEEFQGNLIKLYYQSPNNQNQGLNKFLIASLLDIYRDDLKYLDKDEIDRIVKNHSISPKDSLIPYDKMSKGGKFIVHIVFADNDAVRGYFNSNFSALLGKGYKPFSQDKVKTVFKKGNTEVKLFKANENPYEINDNIQEADMIIYRGHAGGELKVFGSINKEVDYSGKIMLVSSCRSATLAGFMSSLYPGVRTISINDTAYGDRTDFVTEHLMEEISKRSLNDFQEIKKSIIEKSKDKEGMKKYVFPGDRSMKVGDLIRRELERNSRASSAVTSASASSVIEGKKESKKISEVEPKEGKLDSIPSKDKIKELVDEPWAKAVEMLYERNIPMLLASASKKDFSEDLLSDGKHYAFLFVRYSALSELNKIRILNFPKTKEYKGIIVIDMMDLFLQDMLGILIPISEETSVSEIIEKSITMARLFENQGISAIPNSQMAKATVSEKSSDNLYAREDGKGGIDLSKIELNLKDEKYISSLNPADLKVLRAAKALKDKYNSLSLLYVHEAMLLLKDNIVKDMKNKELLQNVLKQLKLKSILDPQAAQFLDLILSKRPVYETKPALVN